MYLVLTEQQKETCSNSVGTKEEGIKIVLGERKVFPFDSLTSGLEFLCTSLKGTFLICHCIITKHNGVQCVQFLFVSSSAIGVCFGQLMKKMIVTQLAATTENKNFKRLK